MKKLIRFIVSCSFIFFPSCEENAIDPVIPIVNTPQYQWESASLVSQNIDSVKIDSAVLQFGANENIYSFILARNGYLVKEYYRSQFYFYNEFELRSVTKSIISALVGVALQKGLIDSLDQPMLSFFPEYDSPELDPRKKLITVRHLLTMRAGFDFSDNNPPPYLDSPTAVRVKLIIGLPMKYNPGERFYYGSVQTHLLSAIITKRSGLSTLEFAKKYLFTPAKINAGYWSKDPQGIYSGGSGLLMSPRNMARFGFLYLHKGMLDSVRILPQSWIEQSTLPNNAANGIWGDLSNVNYGFSWWTNYDSHDSLYFAAGSGGQYIMIVPSKNAVIVATANPNVPAEIAGQQEDEIMNILVRYVIPSLR